MAKFSRQLFTLLSVRFIHRTTFLCTERPTYCRYTRVNYLPVDSSWSATDGHWLLFCTHLVKCVQLYIMMLDAHQWPQYINFFLQSVVYVSSGAICFILLHLLPLFTLWRSKTIQSSLWQKADKVVQVVNPLSTCMILDAHRRLLGTTH